MANVYSKLYIQAIFAVNNRRALLHQDWRDEVFSYIAGILNERGNYALAVNGYHDHIHLFFDYGSKELLSDLVREIKKASNSFIKRNKFTNHSFSWQSGYGIFSHGYREKNTIIEYVKNQKQHHKKKPFKNEYLHFLNAYEIEFKDEYVFDFLE